ncbi:hypothetical protein AS034_16045 [[Bacillus] enclensis]|uniref:Lipoprotein n=1 Tax=[Bacillus] enclensis TaxID=1402860 RepID=A0A0V8HD11_9BACI|nr:hypothetical protein [[Bacillus] enclensis]KSU60354.1 hypothetical protein AS034_16045 [[Bacillus] enclensis]SCC23533.1 hypothetical protein GA0061094_3319 [[Bacillus] enclensis]
MNRIRFIILLIGAAAFLSGCFDSEESIPAHSIHYLNGKDSVSLFDFENGNTNQLKLDVLSESPYGTTSRNPVEEKTLTMIQDDKKGYQYYLQSGEAFIEIGKVDTPVFGGVYTKDRIYTIVYEKEKAILKEIDPNSFKKVNEWELNGYPEAITADYETGTVYMLSRTDSILLYTLKDGNIKKKQLLDDTYEVNAQFDDDQLIISINQLVRNNGKETNNKEVKEIAVYDTKSEEIIETYTTEHPPKYVVPSGNEMLVISGTPNSNFIETINNQNKVTSSSELKTREVFGITPYKNDYYVISRDGIYKADNNQLTLIEKNEVPDSVDLSIQ